MTTKLIPGVGPETADIAFIGEAPGEMEVREGKPFVGPAGKLLTSLMANSGISRASVYITNTVKERPPNNDISHFITIKQNSVVKTPLYDEYEKLLKEELEAVKPNVAVAVGATPLYALTRRQGITKWRGSIIESTLIPGLKVIPIIHPAAALRQWDFTHMISFDLRRVADEAMFPDIWQPEQKLITGPLYTDATTFLESLLELREAIAFDIEVMRCDEGWEVSCIAFSDGDVTMSIPFYWHKGQYWRPDQELEIWSLITKVLEADRPKKIGQNILFDASFLFSKWGIRTKCHEDTMIGMAMLYPEMPKGLDFICSIYTRVPYYKDDGKMWFKLGGKYEDLWVYNAKDAAVTMEAWGKIKRDLKLINNEESYRQQVALVEPLMYMSYRGMKMLKGEMSEMSDRLDEEVKHLQARLDELAGGPLNVNSTKQLQTYFYVKKGFKPYVARGTGNLTVNKDALKRLARKGCEEAQIILEIRERLKLKSTYLEMELDPDNRLRCSFNPVGTTSGRLSSSKTIFGTGGNTQNLPHEVKEFIVADDGYLAFSVDLSQAENRVVAYIAPEPTMIEAFEHGKDVHKLTASLIYRVPFEEVTHDQRQWGKRANHGLNYDLGYRSFSIYYEIPENDAKFIVERYHSIYPGVRTYHAWVREALSKNKTLTTPLGRTRRFMGRWGDELFKEAYSFIPQSTVADKLNRDGLLFLYNPAFDRVELLNQVHDSVVFQIPLSAGFEYMSGVLVQLKRSLESPIKWMGREFSIPADISFGTNLGDMKEIPRHECTREGLYHYLHGLYGGV